MVEAIAAGSGRMGERMLGFAASADGEIEWVAVGARPVVDAAGRLRRVVCTFTPGVNGHRSTRQLWARAGRLRALLDDLPDTYIVLDADERIVEWFGGEGPLVPGERDRLVGAFLSDLLPDAYVEPFAQALADLHAGLGETALDFAWDDDDEEERFGEAVFRPLPDGLTAVLVRDVTDRWRAEEELLTLEEHYRLLAENAQDVISRMRCSPVVRVDYVSPSVSRVLGYPPEAFYADATLLFRLLRRDHMRFARRIMAGEWDFAQPVEVCYTHRDGHEVWLEQSMTPIVGDDGRIAVIDSVSRDVSERHAQTEHLRASEARFRLLSEHAADVLWRMRCRPAIEMDYISPAITRLLGYTPDEFLADAGLIYRLVAAEQQGELRGVTAGDYDYSQPLLACFSHRDGTPVWLEMRVSPMYDEEGRLAAVQGVGRDVTAHRRRSEYFERCEQQFRLLSEHSHDVMWQLRVWPEVRLEYISPSVERLLGRTAPEFLEDQGLWWRMLTPASLPVVERVNSGDFTPGEALRLCWRHADGREILTEGLVLPVRDEQERLVMIHGVVRDVTDRTLAEQALSALRERDELGRALRGILTIAADDDVPSAVAALLRSVTGSERGFVTVFEDGDGEQPGIVGRAVSQRQTVVVEDAADTLPDGTPAARALATPVAQRGAIVGAIVLADGGEPYGEAHIDLVEDVAAQLAPVLEARRRPAGGGRD
jgi:PAS domain S-box-containing protein